MTNPGSVRSVRRARWSCSRPSTALPGSTVLLLGILLAVLVGVPSPATGLEASLEGTVTLVWGDGPPESPAAIGPVPVLTDASGSSVELRIGREALRSLGGILAIDGVAVSVEGSWLTDRPVTGAAAVVEVASIRALEPGVPSAVSAVSGSQPWVSVMCKFSDVAAEPKDLAYFQEMFSGTAPGLDHYWRELSYDHVNVVGSGAHGWYTLPHPRSYYVDASGNADLDLLFDDCTAVADADIYYPTFVGINLMFNDDIGPYAWGGSHWATLDGRSQIWRVTWEPPWGYSNVCVMDHEMGHGFGLPHSHYSATYDNAWDVMSDTWSYTSSDPTYGQVGQHTIMYHKDSLLGWIRPPEKVTVNDGESTTVRMERSATPTKPGPKMVRIPVPGSTTEFYTVEARKRVGYDVGTPGEGVIIHRVDTTQAIPATVQGTNGAAGAMWTPGELFRDSANGIGIAVVASDDTGFTVAVGSGSAMAASFPDLDAHDGAGASTNANGILEPGETVFFEPSWTNVSTGSLSPTGTLSAFSGPGGAIYTLADASASYGTVASTATGSCTDTGNCYLVGVSDPASRPVQHWDATVTETLSTGATTTWTLHVGSSFADVPAGQWAYPFIETLFHAGVTAGCGASNYCPGDPVSRWQMAVFLAGALTGGTVPATGTVEGMGTYNCTAGGTSLFSDVPPGDPGCPSIHYIASRKITAGCGAGIFCPWDNVTRWEMGVFLATAMAGATVPVSGTVPGLGTYNCVGGGTSLFADVPPGDPGCRFIHFLAAKDVTAGCGGGNYCPADELSRDQMAVFLTSAFDLRVIAP